MLVVKVYILGIALFLGGFRSVGMVLRVCLGKESRHEPGRVKQFIKAVKIAVSGESISSMRRLVVGVVAVGERLHAVC